MSDLYRELMRKIDELEELKEKEAKMEQKLEELRSDILEKEENVFEEAQTIAFPDITDEEIDILEELIEEDDLDQFERVFNRILERGDE